MEDVGENKKKSGERSELNVARDVKPDPLPLPCVCMCLS